MSQSPLVAVPAAGCHLMSIHYTGNARTHALTHSFHGTGHWHCHRLCHVACTHTDASRNSQHLRCSPCPLHQRLLKNICLHCQQSCHPITAGEMLE